MGSKGRKIKSEEVFLTGMMVIDDKEALKQLKNSLKAKDKAIMMYKKKYENFFKDKEIKKLLDEYNDLMEHSVIRFSDKELERYKKFRDKHYKECGNGNHYVIEFVGTGVGDTYKIKCCKCGAEEDITDTESW